MIKMKPLPIVIYPYSTLVEVAKEAVDPEEIKLVVEQLKTTLLQTDTGVGIAAPQVGIPLRIYITKDNIGAINVFINPEIIALKGSKKKDVEGCLSVPKVYARVERFQKVKVKWQDENGDTQEKVFKEYDARVIQHEHDHIDGIMFFDKISKDEYAKVESQIEDIKGGKISESVEYEYKLPENK